ncbi:hypothetical protein [Chryseobacterium sp.]|uniref:tetratricopeptide repeat-containing sensor histidine kinase n=1 Tax=Chryseobacterium sp. TaxID=1871047 RepID=UPI0025BB8F2C|nr:hypothetical protein [Chryseobacterium sp.]MBV8327190.1 hypothetical protein [Chryseobacterium sp.]
MKIKAFVFILFVFFISSCSKERDTSNNFYYDKAFDFKDTGNEDSAYVYFYRAKDLFSQKKDSIGIGKSLINLAIISTQKGDNLGGQETSLEATKYFNENNEQDYAYIKSNYNNLGISSYNLKQYYEAIKFYNLAIKFSGNSSEKNIYLNNKANVLKQLKQYKEAIKIYESIYQQSQKGSPKELARVMTNLARVKWLDNPSYNPEPELLKALNIRIQTNDKEGLIVNYLYLSDYYTKTDPGKSLMYAKEMFETARLIKNPDDQAEALQKLINLDPDHRLAYFNQYHTLTDSLQTSRNKAKNQFALIRFGAEKLRTENAQKETQILKQNIGLGALGICLIAGFVLYQRRQRILQQEKELEVKNTQLKMSKKVHDVVANGIYQVMTKIENQENFDKEEALDELEFVYEKSRDISYEKTDTKYTLEFDKKISELVGSFNNDEVKTYLAGNSPEIWEQLNDSARGEIYQIIRELLVNMKKHSRASIVSLRFERTNNTIKIYYKDNGIGISGDLIQKNGLTNTGSRIETIDGEITFDTKTEKGLKINISFPVI